jgi:hypothetical protein
MPPAEHAVKDHGSSALESEVGYECLFDATVEVVIERSPEFGLARLGILVNNAGHVFEATTGAVIERGPEFGLSLPGTPVNDAGHAYGTARSNRMIAAAWVVAVAGTVVRKCEGVHSAV